MDEDYADLIIYYLNTPKKLLKYKDAVIHYINETFAVVNVPVSQINMKTVNTFGYAVMPKLLGLTSEVGLEASGINRLRSVPSMDLRGKDVLIGIIDTGIDYSNPVFIKQDGTTKIVSIWDQSINSAAPPYNAPFGTEYTAAQINQALTSADPAEVVPSIDENGHGTMMAAVAAGNDDPSAGFSGVAPNSELVIVKLRPPKKYLRDFYFIPDNVVCYQENHIMWGVQYCFRKARDLNRPLVICLGLGTSQGPHDGNTPLSILLNIIGDFPGTGVVISAGNEGNRRRHFFNISAPDIGYNMVELIVGEHDKRFTLELWGNSPGIYSIDILSPGGEYIPRITPGLHINRVISFIYEQTVVYVDYLMTETLTGDQLILLRFDNMTPGTWKFNVHAKSNLPTGFHIWLPMGDMISNETYFVKPDNYTTITTPGNAAVPITVAAYNPVNNMLFPYSSRGYTRTNMVKSTIAAPGVNYIAPNNAKEFISYSGTGVAAAHTAGIMAMILEWGIVNGNNPRLDSIEIKNFLIAGAKRNPNETYPNRDWGYGILDIYNVFSALRSDYGR
jgi:subtilisin family serine protease